MFTHLTPKERIGFSCIGALLLGFFCYLASSKIHQPSTPLIVHEESPPRTVQAIRGSTSPNKEPPPAQVESKVVVHVVGAVKSPGVYTLKNTDRIVDAIHAAGGFNGANESALHLAQKLEDGTQIRVPSAHEETPEPTRVAETPGAGLPVDRSSTRGASRGPKTPTGIIDLNSATSEELQTIPGIGPSTAEKIISYRTEHGQFTSVDELTAVGGIGQKRLEKMRQWLRV